MAGRNGPPKDLSDRRDRGRYHRDYNRGRKGCSGCRSTAEPGVEYYSKRYFGRGIKGLRGVGRLGSNISTPAPL